MPRIRLNGEEREIGAGTTVEGLVAILEREGRPLDRRAIAVEVNREVVPRSTYPRHLLAERNEVEIVTIVGGG
jgi:sulfur carrier protein